MDVFLSYSHHDQARAKALATALESNGWSIWWDSQILVGHEYRSKIQQQLDAARCIVVLWSRASVESSWVCDEATVGLNRGKLVPVLLEDVLPPLGFRQLQTASLLNWKGSKQEDAYQALAGSIAATILGSEADSGSIKLIPAAASRQPVRRAEAAVGLGEVPHRVWPPSTPSRIAIILVVGLVIAAAYALWARSGSSSLSDSERLTRLQGASESLSTLLNGAIEANGDIPMNLGAVASGGNDPWSIAQCIAALLDPPAAVGSGHDDVVRSLHLLSGMRSGDGWKINTQTGVESTAWTGLAFLAALGYNDMKDQAAEDLKHAYEYLSERQSDDGGWMSRDLGPGHVNGFTDYSTFIALRLLLELQASRSTIGSTNLNDQIRRALRKVVSRNVGKGWNEAGTASPLIQDLATLHLIVLVQARQSGFNEIRLLPEFQASIKEWIRLAPRDIAERDVAAFTVLEQGMWAFRRPGEPYLESGYTQKVKLLWQPWSLLLSSYLLHDKSLTQMETGQVSTIHDQLLGVLPKAIEAFSHDETFKAAETLYVVKHAIVMNSERQH
jgi:hypothetical protein